VAFISSAFTAGQTLTAASMEDLRGNANAGHSVFTNEAARDAAITAPTEGMMAYLTAPTVPAATGATTAVPSGVVTIYNGSAWVCVTPVSAYTLNSGTTNSTSYTTTLSGSPGTNPSVTVSTGTTALLSTSCMLKSGSPPVGAVMSVAVSGATTQAASDAFWLYSDSSSNITVAATFVMTALTAGNNTFTLNYRVGGPATLTVQDRRITVQGIA
jgi:hypothetical protein